MCPQEIATLEPDIWEQGVPLEDAPYAFAPEHLQEAYDGSQLPGIAPFLIPIAQVALAVSKVKGPDGDPKLKEMARQIQISKDRLGVNVTIYLEMRDRFMSRFQQGAFVAYGYAIPRDPNDRLVKIPKDVFEVKYINWENSAIKGNGLEFASVLVFERDLAPEIDALLAKKSPAQGTGIKRGPPSSSVVIEQAVRSLIDQGQLPNHNQQKENVGLVRERIHQMHPGEFPHDRGLGHESIRKVLANLIPRSKN